MRPDPPLSNSGPGLDQDAVGGRRVTQFHPNIDTGASQPAAMPHLRRWIEVCQTSEGRQEYWRRFGSYLFTDPPREIPRELFSPPPPALRPKASRRQRKPSLARVARQADKAGIEVARYEVKSDGTVVVINRQ